MISHAIWKTHMTRVILLSLKNSLTDFSYTATYTNKTENNKDRHVLYIP